MALVPGGGYADFCVVQEDLCMRIPEGLSFEQAAAIPEAWLTAYQLVGDIADLQPGEDALVHAGASGVGTAVLQLCKHRQARVVIATVRSQGKAPLCYRMGATDVICCDSENVTFCDDVLKATSGRGVNVILDCVGGSYLVQNMMSCAADSRWVLYGLLGGSKTTVNLAGLLSKRVKLISSTLRNRSLEYRSELVEGFVAHELHKFKGGESTNESYEVILDKVFDMEDVQSAHRYLEDNKTRGKVVLRVT
eukprot:GHVQ01000872.1.p1 GENE.GHVQ01000872.1~~GHVQ01000872.1.p1  ORF type:complete len:250 (-),score=38.98 GHVQ01000872.1:243-992(-)